MKFSGKAFLKKYAPAILRGNIRASRDQRFLIVVDTSVADSAEILRLVRTLFRNANLHHDTHDTQQTGPIPSLSNYSSIVTIFHVPDFYAPIAVESLQAFVESGGGLTALLPQFEVHKASLFGAVQAGADSYAGSEPIVFHHDVFPGLKGLEIESDIFKQHIPATLEQNPEVVSLVKRKPEDHLVWKNTHGKGSVVIWNSYLCMMHDIQGILLQTILSAQTVSAQPIANVGMFVIDDFPAGFSDRKSPILDQEFGLSFLEFLDQKWLPDMLDLSRNYNMPLSFAIPFSYNTKVAPPFDFNEWDHAKIETPDGTLPYAVHFAQQIKNKGELGLHGYNHHPLVQANWKAPEPMIASLQTAMERWKADDLGPSPLFYVPPMNEYDAVGAKAITDAIPSIRVICGSQDGDPQRGGDQPFGPSAWNTSLYCMPRVSWGYIPTDEVRLLALSLLGSLGAWTHFIHPDDIIDIDTEPGAQYLPRNKEQRWWRDKQHGSLLEKLDQLLAFIAKGFPWLRYMTVTPAADAVKRHLANIVDIKINRNRVALQTVTPTDIRIRMNHAAKRSPSAYKNIIVLDHYKGPDYDMYTLRLTEVTGEIKLKCAP